MTGYVLPDIAIVAIKAAYFIDCFWYIPTALFFTIPCVVAALWPKGPTP